MASHSPESHQWLSHSGKDGRARLFSFGMQGLLRCRMYFDTQPGIVGALMLKGEPAESPGGRQPPRLCLQSAKPLSISGIALPTRRLFPASDTSHLNNFLDHYDDDGDSSAFQVSHSEIYDAMNITRATMRYHRDP